MKTYEEWKALAKKIDFPNTAYINARKVDAFSKSKILKEYFGKEFFHVYYETKHKELQKFNSLVTPLELDWYLRTV